MLGSLGVSRPRFRLFAVAAIVAALGAGLIACGDDDDDAGAPATSASSPAATSKAAAAYPVTVTDLLGRQVEIKARPVTIVALSPTAVEYVYALGGTVAGRSASVTFPAAAVQAKEVGTAYQPSAEAILALKPDLVVADSVIHAQPDLRRVVEGLGVPAIFAGADSYQKVLDGITLMGKVLDANDRATQLNASITKARDDAKTALATKKVTAVALIASQDQTLYAAKGSSYAGDVLTQVGLANPAATQPDSGPFPGYTTLPPEKLIEYNPDYVFTITPAPPGAAPRLSTVIPTIPPFRGLKAVTANHVVELDLQLFLQAPGPRIVDAFKAITDAVNRA